MNDDQTLPVCQEGDNRDSSEILTDLDEEIVEISEGRNGASTSLKGSQAEVDMQQQLGGTQHDQMDAGDVLKGPKVPDGPTESVSESLILETDDNDGTEIVMRGTVNRQKHIRRSRRKAAEHVTGSKVTANNKHYHRPTTDQWLKQIQVGSGQGRSGLGQAPVQIARGPAVDTAATTSVATVSDSKYMTDLETLEKPVLFTGIGKGSATKQGTLQVGLLEVKAMKVVEGIPVSVVAAKELYREGWVLVAGSDGAVLVRPGEPDDEWDSIELVVDKQGIPRLPVTAVSETKQAAAFEVRRAVEAYRKERHESETKVMLQHWKAQHTPKCLGCDHCMEAKFKRGDGIKGPTLPKQELDIGFDLMGPLTESNDGNVYNLVGVTTEGVGSAAGLSDKKAATVLKGVEKIMATIRSIYSKPTTVKIRFHTDVDKSFQGEVAAYCKDKEWLQTTT